MHFTKICRPIVTFMRAIGFKIINMIDDWLAAADAASINKVHTTVRLILTCLGWTLNDKGTPPSQSTLFLGLIINSQNDGIHRTKSKNRQNQSTRLDYERAFHAE